MRFSIFDPRYSPAKRIQTCSNQSKVHVKQCDLPFYQIETYAKCIDLLFESKNGHAKWQERISVGAYCIRPLRMSPKGTND